MATNRDTFDRIARSWYGFRHWPLLAGELRDMAARWGSGRLVNLGCAHGPDFLPFAGGFSLYGVDFSRGMLSLAREYMKKHSFHAQLVQADIGELPFRDNAFDYAVSVAAYHHVESDEERCRAFRELRRVLAPGGEAFLSVWNHGQPSFKSGPRDVLVPWKAGDSTLYRHYHLFEADELRSYLCTSGLDVLWMGGERRHNGPPEEARNVCALARRRA